MGAVEAAATGESGLVDGDWDLWDSDSPEPTMEVATKTPAKRGRQLVHGEVVMVPSEGGNLFTVMGLKRRRALLAYLVRSLKLLI